MLVEEVVSLVELHVVVTFSKSGDGWMMEMDDDSVEIERSQHASTTQRGQRETMQEPNGWERDGLQVNLDHPKCFIHGKRRGGDMVTTKYGSRHV